MLVSVGAAQSYVEGVFGGPTSESDSEVSVSSVAPTRIVEANPERLSLTIINLGTYDCRVVFDNNPTITRGIALQAGGGNVSMNVRDDQMLPTREWYGLGISGSTDVFVIQTFRYALTEPTPALVMETAKALHGSPAGGS